jgi:hypothetical protein
MGYFCSKRQEGLMLFLRYFSGTKIMRSEFFSACGIQHEGDFRWYIQLELKKGTPPACVDSRHFP